MTDETLLSEYRTDARFKEISLRSFGLYLRHRSVRKECTVLDPHGEVGHLSFTKRCAALRHLQISGLPKRRDQQAALGIARHNDLCDTFFGIETQPSHLFVGVARVALLRKNRTNFRFEEFLLRRRLSVGGQCGSADGQKYKQ